MCWNHREPRQVPQRGVFNHSAACFRGTFESLQERYRGGPSVPTSAIRAPPLLPILITKLLGFYLNIDMCSYKFEKISLTQMVESLLL